MTYTAKVLQPGETIRFHSRIHWVIYVPGIVLIVLGIVAVGRAAARFGPTTDSGNVPALIASRSASCSAYSA